LKVAEDGARELIADFRKSAIVFSAPPSLQFALTVGQWPVLWPTEFPEEPKNTLRGPPR